MLTTSQVEETQDMLKTLTNEQIKLMLLENRKLGKKHGGAVAQRAIMVAQLINQELRNRILNNVK